MKRKVLLLLFVLALLGAGSFWKNFMTSRHYIELIRPEVETPSDQARVRVDLSKMKTILLDIDYGIAVNIRPILKVDKNTDAWHLRVGNVRDTNGAIATRIWGHKAYNTLEVNWKLQKIVKLKQQEDEGLQLGESPPGGNKSNTNILFGQMPENRSIKCIGVSVFTEESVYPAKYTSIPYDYGNNWNLAPFIVAKYPIAVLPKVERISGGKLVSLMLLDVREATLLGEITPPTEATRTRPNFALDKENDILIATGAQAEWIMAVDLRPYIRKKYPNGL
jgi:hypothetical protein